jgi:hypothetical protein
MKGRFKAALKSLLYPPCPLCEGTRGGAALAVIGAPLSHQDARFDDISRSKFVSLEKEKRRDRYYSIWNLCPCLSAWAK